MDYTQMSPAQEVDENGLVFDLGSLYEFFMRMQDTRGAKGKRYRLATLLVLMLLAKLGGEDKPSGITDWVAERKEQLMVLKILKRDAVPCHMTYRRVLQEIVDAQEFDGLISQYHQQRLKEEQEILLTMDGKTLRGTIPFGELRGTHLLTVYVPKQGLVLVQAQVDHKENEIVVAPQVLKQVNLCGSIIIGDAMHTQREVSRQIVEAGGHFLWFVKGNQSHTLWAIEKLFIQEVCNLRLGVPPSKEVQKFSRVSKGHGRLETRTLMASTLLNDYLDWPHVAQVFRLERTVWHNRYKGKTCEIVYGLTDLSPQHASPARLLALTRDYWGIENGLHYRRDVTLHKDATRLTLRQSGRNMAILNNLVLGLCLHHKLNNLAQARRHFCARPDQALNLILEAQ
jgi:predicted transposase YbfD/YdcC